MSFNLKKKNPDMKRNIKFDDELMDLVLDVKFNEHATWKKIRPQQAAAARAAAPSSEPDTEMEAHELESAMSGSTSGSTSGRPPFATGANATPQGNSST